MILFGAKGDESCIAADPIGAVEKQLRSKAGVNLAPPPMDLEDERVSQASVAAAGPAAAIADSSARGWRTLRSSLEVWMREPQVIVAEPTGI